MPQSGRRYKDSPRALRSGRLAGPAACRANPHRTRAECPRRRDPARHRETLAARLARHDLAQSERPGVCETVGMLSGFLRDAQIEARQAIAVDGCCGPGQDRSCQRLATVPAEQRTQADLAGAIAQLYMQERKHAEIREALNLSGRQLQTILRDLFAEGMPKLKRHSMTDGQVRAIYAVYLRGGSINDLAAAIGFTGSAARRQMHKKKLPSRQQIVRAKTSAHAEQQVITALLMDWVHELRKAQGLTIERLAYESDLSMWTLHRMTEQLSDPKLSTVLRLCRGLGVTPGDLLGDLPLPIEPRPRVARRPARAGADT